MRGYLLLAGLLAACTTSTSRPPTTPDYRAVATEPAPAQADLYAACLGEAVAAKRYARAVNEDTTLLLFTCTGEPARAFYDGLAAWATRVDSQFERGGRTYRATAKVRENLFGVDYCSVDATGAECVITLNVGDFAR